MDIFVVLWYDRKNSPSVAQVLAVAMEQWREELTQIVKENLTNFHRWLAELGDRPDDTREHLHDLIRLTTQILELAQSDAKDAEVKHAMEQQLEALEQVNADYADWAEKGEGARGELFEVMLSIALKEADHALIITSVTDKGIGVYPQTRPPYKAFRLIQENRQALTEMFEETDGLLEMTWNDGDSAATVKPTGVDRKPVPPITLPFPPD